MELGADDRDRRENLREKFQRNAVLHAALDAKKQVRDDLNHDQFFQAAQKLHLPLQGLVDLFNMLDKKNAGTVNLDELVNLLIEGNPPETCKAHVRSAYAQYVCEDNKSGSGGYRSQASVGAETNFLGSRGEERRKRGENRGKPSSQQQDVCKSRNLNSSVHVYNQQRALDLVDVSQYVLDGFRASIIKRGGCNAVHALARIFRSSESDGSRKLGMAEFKSGLKDFGVSLDEKSLSLVMAAFDRRGNGVLSAADFIAEVRGPVSTVRRSTIDRVYAALDPSGSGLSMRTIQGAFCPKHYPDVPSGRLAENQALENFAAQFDFLQQDGTMSRDEWLTYYKNVSCTIEDDKYFDSMMKGLWRVKR